ncbi:MAG: WD40 repeat domain-containing protein, partial [Chloroflexota bacterium]
MKFSKATFCTLLVALVIFPVAAQDSMSIELVYEIDDVYVGEFSAISDVVLSPDGDHIIYADNDSNLVLFNILELEVVDVFEVPDSTLMPLFQWASNERYVAVTYDDGVRVWDVSNGTVTLFIENTRTVIGGLSTNSIAVTANNSDLAIYDLVTGNVGFNVDYDDPRRLFVEVDFQPGGDMVAINFDYERVVEIWNIEENTLQKEIRIPAEEYRSHSVSFSPDGTLFVIGSGSWLGKTSAWRIVDWEPLWTYEAPLPSTGLNWSADGGHLFS